MKTTLETTPTLREGERLDREEFMDRWEALPNLKHAELIGGKVPLRLFPLSLEHGGGESVASMWLGVYAAATPGCICNGKTTWYMRDDAPEPEGHLRILPEYGGQSSTILRNGRHFGVGAPKLVVEVSLSTRTYDLSVKKNYTAREACWSFPAFSPKKRR